MKKELDYYTQQGLRTKVKKGTFKDFPDDVGEICKIIQGLLLYPWHAFTLYGVNPSSQRLNERYGKTVQESIDHILKLNRKPLAEYREPAERVLNICRHFAMFMCSILREKGIPARCRCGFATYFRNAWFDDHRICEYRNAKEKRRCRVDSQMGDIHILKYKINRKTINFVDLPKDIFFPGGVTWKLYRMGAVSGNFFGYDLEEGEFGERYIRGNMLRDFFALNNMEYSYQEESKLMDRNYTPAKADLLLLDTIADLTIHADERFDELVKFCKEHPELRP